MFIKGLKLKMLEHRVSSAIGVVTSTIEKLENSNKSYGVMKAKLDDEISQLSDTHLDIHLKMQENDVIINNFKSLLK